MAKIIGNPTVALNPPTELQDKIIAPTTSQQVVTADDSYDGLNQVTVEAVTASIDDNIVASNIREGVEILGVEGTLEVVTNPSLVSSESTLTALATEGNISKIYKYTGNTTDTYIRNEYYKVMAVAPATAPNEGYPYYVIMYEPVNEGYRIIWLPNPSIYTNSARSGGISGSGLSSSSDYVFTVNVLGPFYYSDTIYSTVDEAATALNSNINYTYTRGAKYYMRASHATNSSVEISYSGTLVYYSNFDGTILSSNRSDWQSFTKNILYADTYTLKRVFAPALESKTVAPTTSTQTLAPSGSYEGISSVTVSAVTASIDSDIKAANIKSGVNILGVEGTYTGEEATLQSKTVAPTTSTQTVSPDSGYDGLSSVSVEAVTSAIDENIIPENIAEGVTILGVEGTHSGGNSSDLETELLTRTITEYNSDSLTTLGAYAFAGCTQLESVNLPNLTSVGQYAFYDCDKLTSISFPNVINVNQYAFSSCDKLTSFDIPNVRSLGDSAFSHCTTLREITIPENVTTLSDNLFRRCTSLESAIFMGDITKTYDTVFYECTNLKTIDFTRCTSIPTFVAISAIENFVRDHSDELKIYVPWSLYTQWKSAEQWSYWAEHIDYRMIEDVPTISLNGDILTMNDPSGIATSFYVDATSDDNNYFIEVEGNTLDLTTVCQASGTYTISVRSHDGNGIYSDSDASNAVEYTITLPKLATPEIWLEGDGYSITFKNPVHYFDNDGLSAFTFYINDTPYTGSALTALAGQTITGVSTIGCSSTKSDSDYQYVFNDVNGNDYADADVEILASSYGSEKNTYTLTGDLTAIGFGQHSCLDINTVVSMYDGSTKLLGEIEVGDIVKSWDFENNVAIGKEITSTNLYKPKAFRTAIPYYKLTFSDGTVIKHAATHRFYNVEQKAFVYTIYWNIGDHTYKEDGSYVSLVSMESINEQLVHGMITMDDYTCYFANGLMTGDRRCPTDIVIGEATE